MNDQGSLDMEKLAQRMDQITGLIDDEYLPISLIEIKKLIEAITNAFGGLDRRIIMVDYENPSGSSGSNHSPPIMNQGF